MSERFVAELRDMSRSAERVHRSDATWVSELAARVRRARRRREVALAGVAAALVVGVVVSSAAVQRGAPPVPPAATSAPPGAQVTSVTGHSVCTLGPVNVTKVDGVPRQVMSFTCDLTLSDPRVSGTEAVTVDARFYGPSASARWTTQSAVLTTEGGVWRGTGSGAMDLDGNLPALPGDSIQMGVLHYVGEGAFEGLQLTYNFAGRMDGDNRGYDIVGWIEPVG